MTYGYQPLGERSRAIAARWQQPIEVEGRMWVCSRDAARISGFSIAAVHKWVQQVRGVGVPLTTANGVRFIRVERAYNDKRALLFFLSDTLPEKE